MRPIIHFFKKINLNVFDYLIIALILIVGGFFLVNRFSKKSEWITIKLYMSNDEWWWEGDPPQYWHVDDLQMGQTAYNSFGEEVAQIIDTQIFDTGAYYRKAILDIKLKVLYDKKQGIYLYQFRPLEIGNPIEFTFGKYNLRGLITYLGSDRIEYENKVVKFKVSAISPWVANQIAVGDVVKDSNGEVLAEILDFNIQPNSYYDYSDIRGRKIMIIDPVYKDIEMTMKIKATKSGYTYYYVDRSAIKLDERIWFQFDDYALRDAIITQIVE